MPEVIISDKNRSMERNKHRRHQINVTHPVVLNIQKSNKYPSLTVCCAWRVLVGFYTCGTTGRVTISYILSVTFTMTDTYWFCVADTLSHRTVTQDTFLFNQTEAELK